MNQYRNIGWSSFDLTPPSDDRDDAIEAEAETRASGLWGQDEVASLLCDLGSSEWSAKSKSLFSLELAHAFNTKDFLAAGLMLAKELEKGRVAYHVDFIEQNEVTA